MKNIFKAKCVSQLPALESELRNKLAAVANQTTQCGAGATFASKAFNQVFVRMCCYFSGQEIMTFF